MITAFARCNKPYQSKLYASENRPTSYLELIKNWLDNFKEGDKFFVTVGKWITQRDFNLVIVTTPNKHQRTSAFDKHYGNYLDKYIGKYSNSAKEGFIEFYKYLFSKFRKEAKNDLHTYLITTAYCNLALNLAKEKADGVLFPSVPANGDGMNLAFNSNITTLSNFKLSKVIRNEMAVTKDGGGTNFKDTGLLEAKSFDTTTNEINW